MVHLEFLLTSKRLSIRQEIQRTLPLKLAGNPEGLPVDIVFKKDLFEIKRKLRFGSERNADAPFEVERHPNGSLWN